MKRKSNRSGRASPREFSHLDEVGAVRMVNVVAKPGQQRRVVAVGTLICRPATIRALRAQALPKGDVLAVACVAAMQAVKRTADLIPLCHPLPIGHIEVSFRIAKDRVEIECVVATAAKTGVEMEALTGVSIAALTLYDMCKAVDKGMGIEGIRVLEKTKT